VSTISGYWMDFRGQCLDCRPRREKLTGTQSREVLAEAALDEHVERAVVDEAAPGASPSRFGQEIRKTIG
jgi:hypothetical protein